MMRRMTVTLTLWSMEAGRVAVEGEGREGERREAGTAAPRRS